MQIIIYDDDVFSIWVARDAFGGGKGWRGEGSESDRSIVKGRIRREIWRELQKPFQGILEGGLTDEIVPMDEGSPLRWTRRPSSAGTCLPMSIGSPGGISTFELDDDVNHVIDDT